MLGVLSRDQVLDLLEYMHVRKVRDKGRDNITFCCPVHREEHPSAGISISKGAFNCFSCHERGSIPWFLHRSLPDTFPSIKSADDFIRDRYDVKSSLDDVDLQDISRYEDLVETDHATVRHISPITTLAPFRSGKETYSYFIDRGFNRDDIRRFMIGRDLEQETVTIPVFWEDNVLAGVIGRKIDENTPKNRRYYVYDFPKSGMFYPLNHYKSDRGWVVLVEGILDAMWCHKFGFTEVLALLTNGVSSSQAQWIQRNCNTVVDLTDADKMGVYASESIRKMLSGSVRIFSMKDLYPEGKKDPCDCSEEELQEMFQSFENRPVLSAKRLDI